MSTKNIETATLAGGCFWCLEAVFQNLEGVKKITSGFMGGTVKNPAYCEVVQGTTGHAEVVQLEFDSEKISYRELLLVFFTIHNPTTLNRQGNDIGSQYRSVIFYASETQKQIAEEVVQQLNEEYFEGKIVTEIVAATDFYTAEESHQNFYRTHRENAYCQAVIDPKLQKLRATFAGKLKK